MVQISIALSALLAIIVGLLILVWPNLLRVGVGFYLIAVGIIRLIAELGV